MLEKNRIRERMRAERRKVAPSVRRSASQMVCARILDREDVKGAVAAKQPFAVYLASPQEIDLAPLVEPTRDFRTRPAVYEAPGDVGIFDEADRRWKNRGNRDGGGLFGRETL